MTFKFPNTFIRRVAIGCAIAGLLLGFLLRQQGDKFNANFLFVINIVFCIMIWLDSRQTSIETITDGKWIIIYRGNGMTKIHVATSGYHFSDVPTIGWSRELSHKECKFLLHQPWAVTGGEHCTHRLPFN